MYEKDPDPPKPLPPYILPITFHNEREVYTINHHRYTITSHLSTISREVGRGEENEWEIKINHLKHLPDERHWARQHADRMSSPKALGYKDGRDFHLSKEATFNDN